MVLLNISYNSFRLWICLQTLVICGSDCSLLVLHRYVFDYSLKVYVWKFPKWLITKSVIVDFCWIIKNNIMPIYIFYYLLAQLFQLSEHELSILLFLATSIIYFTSIWSLTPVRLFNMPALRVHGFFQLFVGLNILVTVN